MMVMNKVKVVMLLLIIDHGLDHENEPKAADDDHAHDGHQESYVAGTTSGFADAASLRMSADAGPEGCCFAVEGHHRLFGQYANL